MLEKRVENRRGQKIFLLGKAKEDGKFYWLVESSWDCEWYWGLGYVASYTNSNNPSIAKDIRTWNHFDSMFLQYGHNALDKFEEFFEEMTIDEKEQYKLWELMETCYTLKKTAELTHLGGSHITTNPCKELLKDNDMYEKINKVMLPAVFKEVYKLLGYTEEE